jgi:predicted permease
VERRGATFLQAIVRIKPGSSLASVVAQVNTLFTRLATDHPDVYSRTQEGVVTPLIEYWTGSARLHLWIMLGASLLLLVAATISAGNLFLSRVLSRRQEIATRAALGAGRVHIMQQLAAEGIVAGLVAAAGGLLIAHLTIRFLVRWSPADIPRLADTALHFESFWFAAGAAAFATVACSILPGWFFTHTNVGAALRESNSRTSLSRTGKRIQNVLIFAQAAVTVVSLAMAAFLVLSYRSMLTADTGFANRDALSMNLALRGPGLFASQAYDPKTRDAFYTRLLDRLREAPGVTSAAAILLRPLEGTIGWDRPYQFEFESGSRDDRALPKANYEVITPGYFETVGTPLLEGRTFNDFDTENSEGVVVISRTLAERIRQAGHMPVGHRLRFGLGSGWLKVIGVCADARYRSVTQAGADIFVPYLQALPNTNYVVIRGTRPSEELATLVRDTLAAIDSNQAVAGVATIGELIEHNTARHRFNMIVLLWFGACAAILAAAGVYSVIAESVAVRGREIAIKAALGAQKPRLVREIVSPALVLVLGGGTVGLCCAAVLGTFASELLYDVSPRDPVILGTVLMFLFLVSLGAALCPAWIATGRDPRASLRET